MDPDWLARELDRGRSIADIAREVGRHPGTVAYWVNRYGFLSHHAARHAPRGGIEESRLRELVERGLSIRQIADEVGLSPTSVRHWLRRFRLRTQPARYSLRDESKADAILRECPVHGWTEFTPVLSTLRKEAAKCVLLCANCHAEVEGGVASVDSLRGSTTVRGSSMAERRAVNAKVVGSSPTPGASAAA
jgi:transposase-like protein